MCKDDGGVSGVPGPGLQTRFRPLGICQESCLYKSTAGLGSSSPVFLAFIHLSSNQFNAQTPERQRGSALRTMEEFGDPTQEVAVGLPEEAGGPLVAQGGCQAVSQ